MAEKMPKRDITGDCDSVCRDRVKEGEEEWQSGLENESVESPEDYPKAPGTEKRNNPPGELGGHD